MHRLHHLNEAVLIKGFALSYLGQALLLRLSASRSRLKINEESSGAMRDYGQTTLLAR
jgi:hypothetical protein